MGKNHTTKSISFLMELIFVLFFFTIASAVCVFVLEHAKEKNDTSMQTREALFYVENMLENRDDNLNKRYLAMEHFNLDEKGKPTKSKGMYQVGIQREEMESLPQMQKCMLTITMNGKELVKLPFLYAGEGDIS